MSVNRNVTVLPSAVRTATSTTEIESDAGDKPTALVVTIVTTLDAAAASHVPTIERYDPTSDTWILVLTAAAIAAVGTITLTIGIGVTAVANVAINSTVFSRYRIVMTAADGDAITYSIGAEFINS